MYTTTSARQLETHIPPWPITWTHGELLALRPDPRLSVAEWADSRRVLGQGISRMPGPWATSITPYLKEPMNAYNNPNIRHIVLCFGTQLGKTETIYNMIGFIIDLEPYNTLLVYPTEDIGKEVSRTRLQPTIETCPALRSKKLKRRELYQILEMHFMGMTMFIAGANSAAGLSQRACRNIMRDEIDKYPERIGKDADPLSLSEERAKSFWDIRKIIDVSSPTLSTLGIWRQLQNCDEIRGFCIHCPHCHKVIELEFNQIKWQKEGDKYVPETATYECQKCQKSITDAQKIEALASGQWQAKERRRSVVESVGFHLSSLYSPWLTWADMATQFLKANEKSKTGDRRPLQNFRNGWLALPWEEYEQTRTEGEILKLRDDRPRGIVPSEGVLALTAGVDVQDNGFFYSIYAWGKHFAGWLVREGFVETWGQIATVLWESRYCDVDETEYTLHMTFMDAMGHRTAEVYDFCRGKAQIRPIRGEQHLASPQNVTKIDVYPGTKKPIKGGVQLFRLDSTYYKNQLSNKLQIVPGDPGGIRFHAEATEDFAKQMTAEYIDEKGVWQCRPGRANHYWDTGYMALAAADYIGVQFARFKEHQARRTVKRRIISKGVEA